MAKMAATPTGAKIITAVFLALMASAAAIGAAEFGPARACSGQVPSACPVQHAELAQPSGRPGGILGPKDQRRPVTSAEWPWSSIGRVNLVFGPSHRGICTGTLTGPRQVVTAAHCLFNTRLNDWAKPQMMHFVVGQTGETNLGHSMVENFVVSPDFKFRVADRPRYDIIPGDMIPHDWAILTLRDAFGIRPIPILSSRDGELPLSGSGQEVALAGYGVDRQFLLSIHRGCSARIGVPSAGAITHTCDSMPGQSGGPILLLQDGNASLIGLMSAASHRYQPQVGYQAIAGYGVSASAFANVAAASNKTD